MRGYAPAATFAVLALLALCPGCRGIPLRAEPTPPPADQPEPCPPVIVEPPESLPSAEDLLLQEVERALDASDNASAIVLLEEALQQPGIDPSRRAQVRFQLAMLFADPGSPVHDRDRARTELERVDEEGPGSSAARQADVVLALLEVLQGAEKSAADEGERARRVSRQLQVMERDLGICRDDVERIKQILLPDEAPPPGR